MDSEGVEEKYGDMFEDATEEEIEIASYGIPLEYVAGWYKGHEETALTKNNKLRRDFFIYVLNCMNSAELLKIEQDKLNEKEKELLLTEIENRGTDVNSSIVLAKCEELEKMNKDLRTELDQKYVKIADLQEERDALREKSQQIIDSIEVMDYNQKIYDLALELINIFIKQKIKADLTAESIQLIKELTKK